MALRNVVFILLLTIGACRQTTDPPFFSRLQAGPGAPVYATYAAAMERSQFVLDEGYEFRFDQPGRSVAFTTDTGGEAGIGFRENGKWVNDQDAYFAGPVITASYPDLVHYYAYPYEGIRVDGRFLVYSSAAAIFEVDIANESDAQRTVELFPFMRNDYRTFGDVEELAGNDGLAFTHEEYPDGWTLSHQMPYVDSIRNVFRLSEPADELFSFNSLAGESPRIPFSSFPEKDPVLQIIGRAFGTNGERTMVPPPLSRFQVFLGADPDVLITENSPAWGNAQGAINLDGVFRAELSQLPGLEKSRQFTFTWFDEEKNLGHRYIRNLAGLSPPTQRIDVTLQAYELPPIPVGAVVALSPDRRTATITWTATSPNFAVNIYRRRYPGAVYRRIAKNITSGTFTVNDLDPSERNGFLLTTTDLTTGQTGMHSRELVAIPATSFDGYLLEKQKAVLTPELSQVLGMKKSLVLVPGARRTFRLVRMVAPRQVTSDDLSALADQLMDLPLDQFLAANERLFAGVPPLQLAATDEDLQMLYWSAFNMMRQVFYPPEGKSTYNYYVFSREPTWGWGHGGQVFHESLTMPAYALLDAESAMNSQRVYAERQYENGYINYRTGSYLDEIIDHEGQLTSSAPWYARTNWELYQITRDREFLRQMYASSKRFYEFYISNRDSDGDGLCEWGGHAILESVRDAAVAVWDEVGWPSHFEAVDLNCMLVSEAKALAAMAGELGLSEEAARWQADYEHRTELINSTFWDEATGFYYHVDQQDHDFSFHTPDDLKRMEIIGFLPLWAGVAPPERAARLLAHLTDPAKFWRPYGVPSLAADDPFYNDKGYWNGPVWVEWNYLIFDGLLHYGYEEQAHELTRRVAAGMVAQLKANHNLWEFYSPDDLWAGYHRTYIWAGIINRMLLDSFGAPAN